MFLQPLLKFQQKGLIYFMILYCRPKAYTKMFWNGWPTWDVRCHWLLRYSACWRLSCWRELSEIRVAIIKISSSDNVFLASTKIWWMKGNAGIWDKCVNNSLNKMLKIPVKMWAARNQTAKPLLQLIHIQQPYCFGSSCKPFSFVTVSTVLKTFEKFGGIIFRKKTSIRDVINSSEHRCEFWRLFIRLVNVGQSEIVKVQFIITHISTSKRTIRGLW